MGIGLSANFEEKIPNAVMTIVIIMTVIGRRKMEPATLNCFIIGIYPSRVKISASVSNGP